MSRTTTVVDFRFPGQLLNRCGLAMCTAYGPQAACASASVGFRGCSHVFFISCLHHNRGACGACLSTAIRSMTCVRDECRRVLEEMRAMPNLRRLQVRCFSMLGSSVLVCVIPRIFFF